MTLFGCAACAHVVFPPRLLCPRCGGGAWEPVDCPSGWVEAVTALERDGVGFCLVAVRTPPGPVVLARLGAAAPGAEVGLEDRGDGAVIGRMMEERR